MKMKPHRYTYFKGYKKLKNVKMFEEFHVMDPQTEDAVKLESYMDQLAYAMQEEESGVSSGDEDALKEYGENVWFSELDNKKADVANMDRETFMAELVEREDSKTAMEIKDFFKELDGKYENLSDMTLGEALEFLQDTDK
jgi:hypothetical protein